MIQAFYVLLFSACFFLVYALFTTGAPLPGKWHLAKPPVTGPGADRRIQPNARSCNQGDRFYDDIDPRFDGAADSSTRRGAAFREKFGLDSASGLILIITAVIIVILPGQEKEHPQSLPHESIH